MPEIGRMERDNLMVGGYPVVTQEIEIEGPAAFVRGDVIAKTDENKFALADVNSADAKEVYGIICDPVTAEDNETVKGVIYVKGTFSHRHLNFAENNTSHDHRDYMTKIGLIVKDTIA